VRILLACPYAWDVAGGVQTHVRELAAALVARDHEVAIVAPTRTRHPVAPTTGRHPTLHVVGRTVTLPWGGTVVTLCPSYASFRRVRDIVATFRPDVVHVHEPFLPSTSMLAALVSDVPVVATFHAFKERSLVMQGMTPLLRIVCRRISAPIAVSATARALPARVLPGPIAIVPNGVCLARFRRARCPIDGLPPGRIVLWVHRLEPRKGFAIALRAFTALAATLDDVHLVVIGEGSARAAQTSIPSELRHRVHMLGAVRDEDLPRYHAAADVFIAPAIGQESFGLALVEAMAAGLPVVASDIRGYREVVHPGVDGLLVPPADPSALAAALHRVLTDPELAASLARAGRMRAERYSWDVVAPTLGAIYRELAPATATSPTSAASS
jgi:phosphatidylinositol alpha-mannosyltransferase